MDKKEMGFIEKNGELVPVTLAPQELALKDKLVTHRKTDKPKNYAFRYDATSVIKRLTAAYNIRYRLYKRKIKTKKHKNPQIRDRFRAHDTICEVGLRISALKIKIVVQKLSFSSAMRALAFKLHKIYISKIIKDNNLNN